MSKNQSKETTKLIPNLQYNILNRKKSEIVLQLDPIKCNRNPKSLKSLTKVRSLPVIEPILGRTEKLQKKQLIIDEIQTTYGDLGYGKTRLPPLSLS